MDVNRNTKQDLSQEIDNRLAKFRQETNPAPECTLDRIDTGSSHGTMTVYTLTLSGKVIAQFDDLEIASRVRRLINKYGL